MKKKLAVLFLVAQSAWASVPGNHPGLNAQNAPDGTQKPLEVNGQSRNLNMMLVLRNDKDKIKFVKVRENYRNEILEENGTQNQTSKTTTEGN